MATTTVSKRDLVAALQGLADEIHDLRKAISRDATDVGERQALERLVQTLSESLEELEADNASLRAENETLRAAQEQVAAALTGEAPLPSRAPARPDPHASELLQENARLRDSLARAQSSETAMRTVLRQIDSSRAWRLVSWYWTWARRFGRGR